MNVQHRRQSLSSVIARRYVQDVISLPTIMLQIHPRAAGTVRPSWGAGGVLTCAGVAGPTAAARVCAGVASPTTAARVCAGVAGPTAKSPTAAASTATFADCAA